MDLELRHFAHYKNIYFIYIIFDLVNKNIERFLGNFENNHYLCTDF